MHCSIYSILGIQGSHLIFSSERHHVFNLTRHLAIERTRQAPAHTLIPILNI